MHGSGAFVFDGGVLTAEEIARIRLDEDELTGFEFFSKDELPIEMTETLRRRVLAAWAWREQGRRVYLEGQK